MDEREFNIRFTVECRVQCGVDLIIALQDAFVSKEIYTIGDISDVNKDAELLKVQDLLRNGVILGLETRNLF
jgi:predicted metal-binding protein